MPNLNHHFLTLQAEEWMKIGGPSMSYGHQLMGTGGPAASQSVLVHPTVLQTSRGPVRFQQNGKQQHQWIRIRAQHFAKTDPENIMKQKLQTNNIFVCVKNIVFTKII